MRRKTAAQLKAIRDAEEARAARFHDDKRIVTIEYYNEPADRDGKVQFSTLCWHAGYHLGARWWSQHAHATDETIRDLKRRWRVFGLGIREVRWIKGSDIRIGDRVWDGEAHTWVTIVNLDTPTAGGAYYKFWTCNNKSMLALAVDKCQVWREWSSPEELNGEAQHDAVTDFCEGRPSRVTGNAIYDEAYACWRAEVET